MPSHGLNPSFWSGRRVFVTGHTGFMGGWLTLMLARMGARVSGYALPPPTHPNLFTAAGVDGACRTVIGDVRDAQALSRALTDAEPEVVLHLAAQPLVRLAHAEPVETYATNVMGTVHLLDAVRRVPSVKAVVAVTTDKVYENREWTWGYRETDLLGGREPYGNSKACAEFVVNAYRHSYFSARSKTGFAQTGIATVRAGNIIGGGDWAIDRLVPDAVRAFAANKTLKIRHPEAVRPFQHVLDPVYGMALLAERLATDPEEWAGGWNFGPPEDDTRAVGWMADRLAELWGPAARWHAEPSTGPHEARLLVLSSAQARARLRWQPAWNAEAAIARTVEWYRTFYDGADVGLLTRAQITQHEAALAVVSVEKTHDSQASAQAKPAA